MADSVGRLISGKTIKTDVMAYWSVSTQKMDELGEIDHQNRSSKKREQNCKSHGIIILIKNPNPREGKTQKEGLINIICHFGLGERNSNGYDC